MTLDEAEGRLRLVLGDEARISRVRDYEALYLSGVVEALEIDGWLWLFFHEYAVEKKSIGGSKWCAGWQVEYIPPGCYGWYQGELDPPDVEILFESQRLDDAILQVVEKVARARAERVLNTLAETAMAEELKADASLAEEYWKGQCT
jgi:hypothetical protein